ncbi:hypothetical protein RCH16_003620 [Cryobacterium sp. MP_M5]|uniref:HIRAN domain-containing protein n=1 Tax=unclassified Cryobacterium TaxID=2649013 RepID=UPI0018C8F83F|nr:MULTISPECIES: HIRAN domain-containing protein [unclassified Cryobacterium]MBG6060145.1 hypothetical protein [Cryobacterium sp. MP_M3]MEC5178581.1 hypothetical protein [Cryobacterium sp. MP_M5]
MGILQSLFGRKTSAPPPLTPKLAPHITITRTSRDESVVETFTVEELKARVAENDAARALEPPEPKVRSTVKKKVVDVSKLKVLDLRSIPATKYRIVGSAYSATQDGLYAHGGNEYLLIREPRNKHDANAVAVYGKGRRVGYATRAKAKMLAPILDPLPYTAFLVAGTGMADSVQMQVGIPAAAALQKFVKALPV